MEKTQIVIIGAGPAGLTLGLCLARHRVKKSIILEKEHDITQDPRGVCLTGDSNRIMLDIGLGSQMATIAHEPETVNFHQSSFQNPPFFTLKVTDDDLNQSAPIVVFHMQPRLEAALRAEIEKSEFCELRCDSEVVGREELEQGIIVEYKDSMATSKKILCSWLVGADGKKGVVRKRFLEPTAGIIQETGLYAYSGTWVAANLKITLPTPQSHPRFPLWKLGYSPEEVYDLFWPPNWHFCNPPGKPVACGRFGPTLDRFWRHEFAEHEWDNNSMDPTSLLWENLLPMITRNGDPSRTKVFPGGSVIFPQDCIDIKRCRPFTFQQKVVNKWFHNRTIIIGDAAHVFPPFGGQGIACGVRDAHGLAWRLAVLLTGPSKLSADSILNAWANERRHGVDQSTRETMQNGMLANKPETWAFYAFKKTLALLSYFPSVAPHFPPRVEHLGYKFAKGGFFLPEFGGGGKLSQIYLQSSDGKPFLSDEILRRGNTIFTLLVIDQNSLDGVKKVKAAIRNAALHPSILSESSIVNFCHQRKSNCLQDTFSPVPLDHLSERNIRPGYSQDSYGFVLGTGAKFAIIRPDFIIFATASDLSGLEDRLTRLEAALGRPISSNHL